MKGNINRLLSISSCHVTSLSCHGRHLAFDRKAAAASKNPTIEVEPNIKWIGSPVAEIWPYEIRYISIRGVFMTPILGKER